MTKTYYNIERMRKTISSNVSETTVTIRIKSDEHLLKTRWNFNGCILIETEIHIFSSAPLRLTCMMQHTRHRIVISGRIFIIIYILQGS